MKRLCKWAGYTWLILESGLILMGLIGNIMAGTFWEIWSPFNVINYVVIFLTLAPGLALLLISGRIKE